MRFTSLVVCSAVDRSVEVNNDILQFRIDFDQPQIALNRLGYVFAIASNPRDYTVALFFLLLFGSFFSPYHCFDFIINKKQAFFGHSPFLLGTVVLVSQLLLTNC